MIRNIKSFRSWLGPRDSKQLVPSKILQVVSSKLPLGIANELISENVKITISGRTFHGIQFWFNWLAASKSCCSEGLSLEPLAMTTNDDRVKIKAIFCCIKNGQKVYSSPVIFYHWVADDKVVRVCTCWKNYEFIFGNQD